MKIKYGGARLGGRPDLRFAPLAAVIEPTRRVFMAVTGSHQKISYRRLRASGLDALQAAIEPRQVKIRVEILDRSIGSEIYVARKACGVAMVRPGSDEQLHG